MSRGHLQKVQVTRKKAMQNQEEPACISAASGGRHRLAAGQTGDCRCKVA